MIRLIQRTKRSKIWKLPKEDLLNIVKSSHSISQILNYFGLSNKGGNYKTLQQRLKSDDINFSHIKLGINSNLGRKFPFYGMTKEEVSQIIFIKNSSAARTSLKRYLKRYNLIPYLCECGIKDIWNNNSISLQLHHVNGVENDHRLENLRWLCPNCHSQTKTFCGRNK